MRKKDPINTEKRKAEILQAAEQCFLDNGLHQTNMRNIAEVAQLSLGNIYRYFENKEALLNEYIQQSDLEATEYVKALSKSWHFKHALKELLKGYYEELSDRKRAALYTEIFGDSIRHPDKSNLKEIDNRFDRLFLTVMAEAEAEGKIQLALPAPICAKAIIALTEDFAISQHLEADAYRFEDLWQVVKHLIGDKERQS